MAKPMCDPGALMAAERTEHEATRLPFRSWCAECIAGRRDNPQHRHVDHDDDVVPEVLIDYRFIRREEETDVVTVLIIKDRLSRAIQAWVVEQKGVGLDASEAVKSAVDGIRSLGHQGQLLIKTDTEPAISRVGRRCYHGRVPAT